MCSSILNFNLCESFLATQDIRSSVLIEHTGPNKILSDQKSKLCKKKKVKPWKCRTKEILHLFFYQGSLPYNTWDSPCSFNHTHFPYFDLCVCVVFFTENKHSSDLCQNGKTQNQILRHRTFWSGVKKWRTRHEALYIDQSDGQMSYAQTEI